jgi:transposase
MVCEAANKIEEGMTVANQSGRKKQIKYTISLTELLPSSVEVFTQQSALSEDVALSTVILKNIDKKVDNIFVFDRGLRSREHFCKMDTEGFSFVTRINKNSRYEVIEDYDLPQNLNIGNLIIQSDQKVYLFSKAKKQDHTFRLVKAINDKNESLWFLTNSLNLTIEEIIKVYKRRWDIEVFFRFIKQELNFKHFMSTNINGIKVILYMTLILAMLILMFKKLNNIGFKIATRRFYYQLDDLILEMVAVLSHRDPNLVFR